MSSTDINALTRQKELLLQKLSTFEETNRTLRELLAEQQCREVRAAVWSLADYRRLCWPLGWKGILSLKSFSSFSQPCSRLC